MTAKRHTDTDIILATRNLGFSIAGRKICNQLDLTIRRGECLGVLGQNGTGKTSLLHTLMNFRRTDEGEIELCGRLLTAWSRNELAQRLGILFQSSQDDMPATVLETALLGRHPHLAGWQWESSSDLEQARSALHALSLDTLAEREINSLSGGERQRLAIATLLTQNPQLYLLDEPGNHLDVGFQVRALTLLRKRMQEQGAALCMATHDINLAARFCDQILLLLGDGSFVLGSSAQVLTPAHLSRAYECEIRQVFYEDGSVFIPA